MGPVLRMLTYALYTCAFLSARHMAVRRRKDLVAYFKASADLVQPGKIQQGGEVHDSDNEATQSESERSDIDESSGSRTSASKRARLEQYDSEWQRKYDRLTPVKG